MEARRYESVFRKRQDQIEAAEARDHRGRMTKRALFASAIVALAVGSYAVRSYLDRENQKAAEEAARKASEVQIATKNGVTNLNPAEEYYVLSTGNIDGLASIR